MKTQAQLIAEQRKQLDAAWHKRYPNGQFTLRKHLVFGLHYDVGRTQPGGGIHVVSHGPDLEPGPIIEHWRSCLSRGLSYYKTYESFIKATTRHGVPADVIAVFTKLFTERDMTVYVIVEDSAERPISSQLKYTRFIYADAALAQSQAEILNKTNEEHVAKGWKTHLTRHVVQTTYKEVVGLIR